MFIKSILVLCTIANAASTETVTFNINQMPCDFDSFENGCEDKIGSFCEKETNKCVCKTDFPVALLGYCLKEKSLGEECYTSSQCNQIENASCFIFGKDYDNERLSGGHNVGRQIRNWPTGTCRCNPGHQFDNGSKVCVKKVIGSWCNEDWDCIKHIFNSQCTKPQHKCECIWNFFYDQKTDACLRSMIGDKCSSDADCGPQNLICSKQSGKCLCPNGYRQNITACVSQESAACDDGLEWDDFWGRCLPPRNQSQIQRTKFDEETVVAKTDDSSALKTVLILGLPNLVIVAVVAKYCYYKKSDDVFEREHDFERGSMPDGKAAKAKSSVTSHCQATNSVTESSEAASVDSKKCESGDDSSAVNHVANGEQMSKRIDDNNQRQE